MLWWMTWTRTSTSWTSNCATCGPTLLPSRLATTPCRLYHSPCQLPQLAAMICLSRFTAACFALVSWYCSIATSPGYRASMHVRKGFIWEQVATRNQGALADTLEKLLKQLRLPPASSRILSAPNFTPAMYAAHPHAAITKLLSCRCVLPFS